MVGAAVAAVAALAGDIAAGARLSRPGSERFPQQLRQLGDIRRDPAGLIFGEELGGPSVGPLTQQSRRHAETGGFTLLPTNADFRKGIVGAVGLAVGESPHLMPPSCVTGGQGPSPTTKTFAAKINAGRPELGLPAGSTVRILSH